MSNEIDETKLTAYALDELDEASRVEIEARVSKDDALRREVEQIRALAGQLKQHLAAEPMPEATPMRKPMTLVPATRLNNIVRRPRWGARLAVAVAAYVVVGGVTYSIVAPKLNRAREVAHGQNDLQKAQIDRAVSEPSPEHDEFAHFDQAAKPRSEHESLAPRSSPPAQGSSAPTPAIQPPPAAAVSPGGGVPISQYGMSAGTVATTATPNALLAGPAPAQAVLPQAAHSDLGTVAAKPAQRSDVRTDAFGVNASAAPPASLTVSDSSGLIDNKEVTRSGTLSLDSGGQVVSRGAIALNSTSGSNDLSRHSGAYRLAENEDLVRGRAREAEVDKPGLNTEAYDRIQDNPFLAAMQNPLSTFSIDVDTASYSNVRRFLQSGQRPPKDAVRIEELLNYFPYDYTPPEKKAEDPFAAHVEIAECPWNHEHRLVRVGLKGKEIAADKRPASNLVFLIDVSGSMNEPNKLPLVKSALRMLTEQLGGEDRVAMVVYAGNAGMVLPSTSCRGGEKQSILNALDTLEAGGSTNGAQGIELAYKTAQENFIKGGTNRVILCTDGDFNVGVTNQGDLTRMIEDKAKKGVFLSAMGFGMGNLKDSTMEKLADKGNGNYGYIDTPSEARKVFVEEISSTLVTIAKDVKIQIEFNPAVVGTYRLIGYENRLLAKEDFNNDKKDAGEIGAGHAVTALYEVTPAGDKQQEGAKVDELHFQKPAAVDNDHTGDMLILKLRYKEPTADKSKLIEITVKDQGTTFAKSSDDFKFASSVAAFGMILRDSPHKGSANLGGVAEWAEEGKGEDASGYRKEFLELVKKARGVKPE